MLSNLSIVAFTHQALDLADVGQLVLSEDDQLQKLQAIKHLLNLGELFYIGTCNRVELVMISSGKDKLSISNKLGTKEKLINEVNEGAIICSNSAINQLIVRALNPGLDETTFVRLHEGAHHYEGQRALEHLIRVSCSLESMVVGEKEILAQVRLAYDSSRQLGFCGDMLRLVMDCVVKAAKEVYTNTLISQKPISVVSLAYRKIRSYNIPLNSRILIIGAGKTNTLLSKYLVKHGYCDFAVFSRTEENAFNLAKSLNGRAFPLNKLNGYAKGFDVLMICTSSPEPLITTEIYKNLLRGELSKKLIIDLSLPGDLSGSVSSLFPMNIIDMDYLQDISRCNMEDRYNELSGAERIIYANIEEFKPLLHKRKVEIAMREVPVKIREIRERAMDTIFVKDLEMMDENSRKTLEKVLNYMEKKYISVPMIMARDIMVKA